MPTPVQLDGLPENVVPISADQYTLPCTFPNGKAKYFNCTQVYVLPNFAMTDFNSQGRTHLYNVCDLNNCRSHQSVYTCLSRGSTYDGTLLIQGFHDGMLKGGMSGDIQQEFRDLEILDEITKLKFHEQLLKHIYGESCNALIHAYRSNIGTDHVPSKVHFSLTWSKEDQYEVAEVTDQDAFGFQYVGTEQEKHMQQNNKVTKRPAKTTSAKKVDMSKYISAKGSQQLTNVNEVIVEHTSKAEETTTSIVATNQKKCRYKEVETDSIQTVQSKKQRLVVSDTPVIALEPVGFK